MTQSSASTPRRAHRRWLQFSLRTLLLVTALAAALVAWRGERIVQWAKSLWATRTDEPVDPDDLYRRVEVVGPITSGGSPTTLDPPTEAEILAALSGRAAARRFVEGARSTSSGRSSTRSSAERSTAVVYIDHTHFHLADAEQQ